MRAPCTHLCGCGILPQERRLEAAVTLVAALGRGRPDRAESAGLPLGKRYFRLLAHPHPAAHSYRPARGSCGSNACHIFDLDGLGKFGGQRFPALGTPIALALAGHGGARREKTDEALAMPYGMYISAEGAQVQAARMEVLANNLANVDTPGFKRDVALFQARFAEAVEQGLAAPSTGSVNDLGGGVQVAGVRTDFSSGTIKHTGIPTDFAIDGDGFFAVQKDNTTFLTRAGDFRLTGSGEFVTQQGYPVLDAEGSPIVMDPTLGPWQFDPSGLLTQAGTTFQMALMKPASLGDLVKVGDNLFRPLASAQPLPAAERNIRQGHLEGSGVQPTAEMMQLIETTRAFEANVNLIQNQDSMISTLISRVLQGG